MYHVPQPNGRPKCARADCHHMKHSTQDHAFCCHACKQGKGHGPACERQQVPQPPYQSPQPAYGGRPKCARAGCRHMKHSTQDHAFCCYACKQGKGHGPACERQQAAPPPHQPPYQGTPTAPVPPSHTHHPGYVVNPPHGTVVNFPPPCAPAPYAPPAHQLPASGYAAAPAPLSQQTAGYAIPPPCRPPL